MAKKDRVEEWQEQGVLEEKIALMRSLSMQGYNIEEIGGHDEINVSKRQMIRLMQKHSNIMAPIKKGREYVVGFAQNALMKQIQEGNITAIIYALKVYGGEFFKENKLELQLQKAEFELKKKQVDSGHIDAEKTIVLNIKPASDAQIEQV